MGLRELFESDMGAILEDTETGFGWEITITSPTETALSMSGFSDDISQVIDPDTGAAVSGRLASVALRMSTLLNKFGELPKAINSKTGKPWVVEFDDINGTSHLFKVARSSPDRAAGLIVCILEVYKI